MNRDEVIDRFNWKGQDSGADFNDGMPGYFGWSVDEDDVLLIAGEFHVDDEDDGYSDPEVVPFAYAWKLVPIDDD